MLAQAAYWTQYDYQLFPANTGDPSFMQIQVNPSNAQDGILSRQFDTGQALSGLDPANWNCSVPPAPPQHPPRGFGQVRGAVDLASGSLRSRRARAVPAILLAVASGLETF